MTHPAVTVAEVAGWNPWRALRDRASIELLMAPLSDESGGALAVEGADGAQAVVLDRRLTQAERNAALTHELVHLERGLLPPGSPDHLVAREEAAVRRIAAARLVEQPALMKLVQAAEEDGYPLEPWEIVDFLGLPEKSGRQIVEDFFREVWP